MTRASIQELLQLAREGDQPACAELVALVQPALVHRARALLGPRSRNNSLDDLFQDVWTRAFQKLASFEGGKDEEETRRKFGAWMATLLKRVYLNRQRGKTSRGRRPSRPVIPLNGASAADSTLHPGNPEPTAPDTSVSKRLREADRQRLIQRALQTLDPVARQIVESRLLIPKPMTFREIADALGAPEWRVREMFHASLARLQPHLIAAQE